MFFGKKLMNRETADHQETESHIRTVKYIVRKTLMTVNCELSGTEPMDHRLFYYILIHCNAIIFDLFMTGNFH